MNKIEVSGDVSRKMETLLGRLTDCWSGFNRSRDGLAEVLCEIRTELASKKKFSELLKEHGIPRRTAYDLIEDWEWIQKLKPSRSVRQMAVRMNVELTSKRLRDAIEKYMRDLQKAETEDQARNVLENVKAEKKAKAESDKERLKRQRGTLFSTGLNLLAGMSVYEQVNELHQIVRHWFPEAEINITFPEKKVVSIGA